LLLVFIFLARNVTYFYGGLALKNFSNQKLADEIARCAQIQQEEDVKGGYPKRGNYYAKRYEQAWDLLRARGNEGREALVPYLKDERRYIRGLAAAFLSTYKRPECMAILQELVSGGGMQGFFAEETLKRIEEGVTWDP
jgi:hypothetical protein